jgi:membrane-bound metal-dependent hydrolase YbcI (DUF457 family)
MASAPLGWLLWHAGLVAVYTLPAGQLGARWPDLDLRWGRWATHRRRWHSLGGLFGFSTLVLGVAGAVCWHFRLEAFWLPVTLGFLGGYVSHLAVDLSSPMGLPRLLWPILPGAAPEMLDPTPVAEVDTVV